MNPPMPPYWPPRRRRYARYVLPALVAFAVSMAIVASILAQAPAPQPACQQTGTWQ